MNADRLRSIAQGLRVHRKFQGEEERASAPLRARGKLWSQSPGRVPEGESRRGLRPLRPLLTRLVHERRIPPVTMRIHREVFRFPTVASEIRSQSLPILG